MRHKPPWRRLSAKLLDERTGPLALISAGPWTLWAMKSLRTGVLRLLTLWWWPNMGFRNASRWAKAGSSSPKKLLYGAYAHGVFLDCFRPDKPTDNAFIEAFNNRFMQACLNEKWFLSLEDVQEKIEVCRGHYNEHRPHSNLDVSRQWNISGFCSGPREFTVSRNGGEQKRKAGINYPCLSACFPIPAFRLLGSQALFSGRTGRNAMTR